jgi:hypothetical protein
MIADISAFCDFRAIIVEDPIPTQNMKYRNARPPLCRVIFFHQEYSPIRGFGCGDGRATAIAECDVAQIDRP